VTDPAIIKEYGIHDANPFFSTLLTKPYLDSVVISPHLYGPSVSNRKDFYKGKDWMESLDKAFGYLGQKPGYCANGKCHVFPIAVGEFGSRFTNPEDLAHLSDLALYMNAQGAGNTGGHKAFNNWFYCECHEAPADVLFCVGRGCGREIASSVHAALQPVIAGAAMPCCAEPLLLAFAGVCCIQGATMPTAVTPAVWLTTPGEYHAVTHPG
jgi:hypothetical protein